MAGFRVTSNGNVLFGREFPAHLQVAYGRYIARLCAGVSITGGGIWLRDLPQNLADLDWHGYKHALPAYRAEVLSLAAMGRISPECHTMPHMSEAD